MPPKSALNRRSPKRGVEIIPTLRPLQNRPALAALLALMLGIAIGRRGSIPFSEFALLPIFCSLLYLAYKDSYRRVQALLVLSIIVLLGKTLISESDKSVAHDPERRLIEHISDEKSEVFGVVSSEVLRNDLSFRFAVALDSIRLHGRTIKACHTLRAYLSLEDGPIGLSYGSRIHAFGKVRAMKAPTNPEEFDFAAYQKNLDPDVVGVLQIRSRFDIYKERSASVSGIQSFIIETRDDIRKVFQQSISDEEVRDFATALIIGDRSGMSEETLRIFQRSGASHILAISGFNVAVVAMLILLILNSIPRLPRAAKSIFASCAVIALGAIAGFSPSVVRAVVVFVLIMAGRHLERRIDAANLLGVVALLELIVYPSDLFLIGFQLSYACTGAIVIFYPHVQRVVGKFQQKRFLWLNALMSSVIISLIVTLGTLPIIALNFHAVSIGAVVSNLLILPLSALLTSLAFLLLPLTILPAVGGLVIASLYGSAFQALTAMLFNVIGFFAGLGFFRIELATPSALALMGFMALSYILLTRRSRPQILLSASAMFAFLSLWSMTNSFAAASAPKILFFDVGQGDCCLISNSAEENILIDCGGMTLSGEPIIRRALFPYLAARGLNISHVFLSHMHEDHFGGLAAILEEFPGVKVYSSGERASGMGAMRLERAAQRFRSSVHALYEGDVIEMKNGMSLSVLNPKRPPEYTSAFYRELNHNSQVLLLRFGKNNVLFTGDIEASDEQTLHQRFGASIRSDIVKVAHHGSKTSSSVEFTRAVDPNFAVISVGKNNSFGHPSPQAIRNWSTTRATLLRTDEQGAVAFELTGEKVRRLRTF